MLVLIVVLTDLILLVLHLERLRLVENLIDILLVLVPPLNHCLMRPGRRLVHVLLLVV